MALNSLFLVLFISVASLGSANAYQESEQSIAERMEQDYYKLSSIVVEKIGETDYSGPNKVISQTHFDQQIPNLPGMPKADGFVRGVNNVGQVLALGTQMVALGESVYALISKGKPVHKKNYAPISVLPRNGNKTVDVTETENWKMPKKTSYSMIYKNALGMEIAKFKYSVVYSYGGTYKNKGAWITSAQIIPEHIYTAYGFDFSASMKLNGIQNHGTAANPVAGAILAMEYELTCFAWANMEVDTFHITGRGEMRKL